MRKSVYRERSQNMPKIGVTKQRYVDSPTLSVTCIVNHSEATSVKRGVGMTSRPNSRHASATLSIICYLPVRIPVPSFTGYIKQTNTQGVATARQLLGRTDPN